MENENKSQKTTLLAAVLAFLIGGFGVHNFYLGHTKKGVIQLVLTLLVITAPITFVWVIIDFINILMGKVKDVDGLALA